jgi:hypothetical protein
LWKIEVERWEIEIERLEREREGNGERKEKSNEDIVEERIGSITVYYIIERSEHLWKLLLL